MKFGEPQSQPERDSKKDSQLLASVVFSPANDSSLRISLNSLHRLKANVFTPSLDKM